MSKVLVTLASILGFFIIGAVAYIYFQPDIPPVPTIEDLRQEDAEKPPIVEHFACSDYCPGPREEYIRNVYDGVNNKEDCEALDGTLYTYTGWGTTTICLVN